MMASLLAVGTVLYGFCNGFFGRDSYEDKRVEAFGADWIVARDDQGRVHFANFEEGWLPSLPEFIAEWTNKENQHLNG